MGKKTARRTPGYFTSHPRASCQRMRFSRSDGAELFTSPATIVAARQEFEKARGPNFVYSTRLGTQKPALDYRE